MMKRWILTTSILAILAGLMISSADAQTAPTPAAPAIEATQQPKKQSTFYQVVFGSGPLGFILWMGLFGSGVAAVYFIVDCIITIKEKRIMPQELINSVTEAMAEGDVLKSLECCENNPGPLANILSAGFSHVEEGFEVIQESIGAAADMETEKLMQKLSWISVCANIAPMLGLMGTVQGMIMCFDQLGTGQPDVGGLAIAISQALYTTFVGLLVAIPSVTVFYALRNTTNRIVLRMEAMTMELIKDLRNVEVVEE